MDQPGMSPALTTRIMSSEEELGMLALTIAEFPFVTMATLQAG